MSNIFEIEGDLTALAMLLQEEASVDDTGEINSHLAAWIEESEGEFGAKIEGYCGLMGTLTAMADARKVEVRRLQELESQARSTAERMKKVLLEVLVRLGRDRVETTRYRLRLQKAGGMQPMTIDEFFEIPEKFVQMVKVIDKPAIRAALESGNELPFAKLGDRATILVIK